MAKDKPATPAAPAAPTDPAPTPATTATPATTPATTANTPTPTAPATTPTPTNTPNTPNTPRLDAIVYILASLTALIASMALVITELNHAKNADAPLGCDINPLVGCGSSLDSWQAHLLFGIPNALLGTAAYAATTVIGVLLLARIPLPRWFHRLAALALTAAIGLVIFFIAASALVFPTICPFCMLVWLATLLLWPLTLAAAARANALPGPPRALAFLTRERYLIAIFLIILAAFPLLISHGPQLARLL